MTMRDINRIDRFCDELKEQWKRVPDWRFAQLFVNLQVAAGYDLFSCEEDQMMELLTEYLDTITGMERSKGDENE